MVFEHLKDNQYISLTTYRKSGKAVPTPVWFAHEGARLVVFTNADSGKVKRLRHTSRVDIAPCDARGNLKGEAVPAECFIIQDDADAQHANQALNKKYGLFKRLFDLFGRLRGGEAAFLEIKPKDNS